MGTPLLRNKNIEDSATGCQNYWWKSQNDPEECWKGKCNLLLRPIDLTWKVLYFHPHENLHTCM